MGMTKRNIPAQPVKRGDDKITVVIGMRLLHPPLLADSQIRCAYAFPRWSVGTRILSPLLLLQGGIKGGSTQTEIANLLLYKYNLLLRLGDESIPPFT